MKVKDYWIICFSLLPLWILLPGFLNSQHKLYKQDSFTNLKVATYKDSFIWMWWEQMFLYPFFPESLEIKMASYQNLQLRKLLFIGFLNSLFLQQKYLVENCAIVLMIHTTLSKKRSAATLQTHSKQTVSYSCGWLCITLWLTLACSCCAELIHMWCNKIVLVHCIWRHTYVKHPVV